MPVFVAPIVVNNSYMLDFYFMQPKGRAIQVEDSMIERMPSMELRHAQYRDADVVIQVSDETFLQAS